MWTRKFWMDTGERVVSSAAQGALLGLTAGQAVTSLHDDRIAAVLGAAAFMGVVTLLKCLVASGKGDQTSASLVDLPRR